MCINPEYVHGVMGLKEKWPFSRESCTLLSSLETQKCYFIYANVVSIRYELCSQTLQEDLCDLDSHISGQNNTKNPNKI